jgi:S-adenosylmethionine:tRNA ribosyltransferase-isomerase
VLDGDSIGDRIFRDLPNLLRPDDLLVLNETRVIAARLFGERMPSGGRVELLLLHPANSARYDPGATRWIALARPARRLRRGERVTFGAFAQAVVHGELSDGMREIEFELEIPFAEFLDRTGRVPLPPYIHGDPSDAGERYQTVLARMPGSIAAPTASLHFTPELLGEIAASGIEIARISLDIGLGTFRPVATESIDEHVMHAEAYSIKPEAAAAIERARDRGRRIVAAGTTVVRALEGNAAQHGRVAAGDHVTSCFITPGFRFRIVDALITNFHLPRSTLLMLVAAFAGRERVLRAYAEAIRRRYRFYSFGDAMFVARKDAGDALCDR